jgi:hypothetical protein
MPVRLRRNAACVRLLASTKEDRRMDERMRDAEMRECIDACGECHAICIETAAHCLERGGEHARAAVIRALLDCAQICQTSADFMLRGSELHSETCSVCAEACERCAEACEALEGDEAMGACAEACRRCAASCQEMAHGQAAASGRRRGVRAGDAARPDA